MGKVIKEIIQSGRRRQQWLVRRIHNLTIRQRIICACVAVVLVLAAIIPTVQYLIESYRHTLDDATLKLVGKTNPNLASKLTYDQQNSQWQFNKAAITDTSSKSTDPAKNIPAALKAQLGGGGKDDDSMYAINFPTDPRKGVTFYDAQTQLSFTMTPQFKIHGGKATKDNRIVYPMAGGGQLIYTPKNNGMKEDIVLPKFIGKELTFSYKLDLPNTLSARVQADGSVGIFSIDPSLLGNVSTSSDMDAEKLKSARENAEKNHLLFAIPAPVIAQTGDSKVKATARFGLADGVLTVTARDMDTVQYPVSVDPSVVVTSSSDFQLGGNDEYNINFGTDQISRAEPTGGGITAGWNSTGSGSWTARGMGGAAVYNGHMYWIGGQDAIGRVSEVSYAPINSNGTVGTWNTTTSLPAGRSYLAAVPYNGKMYVYGGYTSGTTALDTVLYADINSDGTLGSWHTASTTMATAVCRFGSAVYNGYLYAVGGATSTVASSCGNSSATMTNTLQYAPILANGDVGAWTTSANTFTNARKDVGLAIYNGYAYISSGTTDGITTYRDTQIAKIGDNGDIGAWRTSSEQIPTNGKYRFGYRAYGGYLYLSGGTNNSTGTLYAPIYANGDIGPWQSSATMATGRYGQGFVIYKGYAYYIGGNDSTNYRNDTGYAKLDDPGTTTAYTTSGNTFAATRRGAATATYNGYLYVIGGDNGTTASTIYYAEVHNDGSVGTWATTTALPAVRTYASAVAYNGYMYVIGGCSATYTSCGSSGSQNTVLSASINNDGTLGSWNVDTALGAARYGLAVVAYNGYVYALGGLNFIGSFNTSIYRQAIAANGRLNGTWAATGTTLPASMAYMKAVAYGGKLYVVGGCTAGPTTCTTTRNNVHYASFNTDGTLSAFTASGTFTTARGDFGLTAVNNRLYLAGGRTNTTYYSDTQSAPINNDGSVGSWVTITGAALATTRYGIGMESANGNLYAMGGHNGSTYYNNVQISAVHNGGGGNSGTWTEDTAEPFTTARSRHQTVTYNGYIYILGGDNSGGTALNDVQYAALNADGSVGTWAATSSFTNARRLFGAAAMNGYLYILGGHGAGYYKDIQYAKIKADGSLEAWASAGSDVSNAGQGACMVAYGGYIYSLGGWDNATDHNSVRYAAQNSNGTIDAWQNGPDFTGARSNAQCLAYNGYLYLVGGEDATGKNDVQYAALNSGDGSVGSWAYTTNFHLGRADHGAVAYNGFMYILGGVDATATDVARDDIQYAPINANGTVGQWQTLRVAANAFHHASAVAYNGYLYITGEDDSSGVVATSHYAPLNTIMRKGTYSRVIDIGTLGRITGIAYGGQLPGGAMQINYRLADADGTFGARYNAGRPPSPEGPCVGTHGSGRYVWLSIDLDDTAGTNATITDITVTYEPIHPPADIRLRSGKTLQNGVLSPLDTCHA